MDRDEYKEMQKEKEREKNDAEARRKEIGKMQKLLKEEKDGAAEEEGKVDTMTAKHATGHGHIGLPHFSPFSRSIQTLISFMFLSRCLLSAALTRISSKILYRPGT